MLYHLTRRASAYNPLNASKDMHELYAAWKGLMSLPVLPGTAQLFTLGNLHLGRCVWDQRGLIALAHMQAAHVQATSDTQALHATSLEPLEGLKAKEGALAISIILDSPFVATAVPGSIKVDGDGGWGVSGSNSSSFPSGMGLQGCS